mgnify:CR=1 FL=1
MSTLQTPSSTNNTFSINGLQVDYSSVITLELDEIALANGMLVEVEGELSSDVLVAAKIEQEDMHHDYDGDIKLYGVISALDSDAGGEVVLNLLPRHQDVLQHVVGVQAELSEPAQVIGHPYQNLLGLGLDHRLLGPGRPTQHQA